MGNRLTTMQKAVRFAGEVVAETLWPTRCALCDAPGKVLCDACERALPFLDWWRACPQCGSAFGWVQCDLCNPVALGRIGRERLPYSGCACATAFDDATGRIVRVYKDQGERRLASVLAARMARVVPPAWAYDDITFVPATKAAFRRRGFDHCELLARALAGELRADCVCSLDRPSARDQRALSGSERISNLRKGMRAFSAKADGRRFLLVDDVLTTGSTLCAATDALLAAGAADVFCVTFARV